MVVYFSATGNSRYCAQMLADRLGDSLTDAFQFIRDGIRPELTSTSPWVFVAPTYSWQMPRLFQEFIRNGFFSGSQEAYFVITCGGEAGGADKSLQALCREKGMTYRGMWEVVMPDNYIIMFKAPKQEEAQRIIQAARPVIEAGAEYIRKGESFPDKKKKWMDSLKSGMVNDGFYRFFIKAKGFRVTESCIGCGKCAQSCVLNNIHMEQGKPVWGNTCTQCMACICGCPVEAIEYGNKTQGKERYQCPPYEG